MNFVIAMLLVLTLGYFTYPSRKTEESVAPKYNVGDCFVIQPSEKEKWEKPTTQVYKIVEIGKAKYRIKYIVMDTLFPSIVGNRIESDRYKSTVDSLGSKVECPYSFRDLK